MDLMNFSRNLFRWNITWGWRDFHWRERRNWTIYWRANIWRRGWGYNECQFIFQQVNNFLFDKKNNSITFKFFGITTIHYLPEGHIFCVELYLILSDDQTDASLTIGECYYDSEQIAGIPEDKTLSDKAA